MAEGKPSSGSENIYIYPHRHCVICGKMLEVTSRPYCLKCKAEYEKRKRKEERSKTINRLLIAYAVSIPILALIFMVLGSRGAT